MTTLRRLRTQLWVKLHMKRARLAAPSLTFRAAGRALRVSGPLVHRWEDPAGAAPEKARLERAVKFIRERLGIEPPRE